MKQNLQWLQLEDVRDFAVEYLGKKNGKILDYLNFSTIQKEIGKANLKEWSYLVLSLWLEKSSHNNHFRNSIS